MLITLLSGFATMASATTVRDLSDFLVESATPQELGRWDGYTGTVTDGQNSSRIIAYSGTSTGSHISLSIPKSAVNDNSDAKPYVLHLSYRIQNDRTNPAYITHRMQYKQSGGSGSFSDIFVTDATTFTLNPDTSLNITSANSSAYNNLDFYDYKVDLYENLKTGAYQIYINGVKWINAYDYSTPKNMFGSASDTINEYRIRVTGAANSSWEFNLVNPCYEIYSQDVLMDEVVAATVSGMSNYKYTTASEQVKPGIDGGDATKSGVAGTESSLGGYTSYDISGASGKNLRWWSGTQNTNGVHCAFVSTFATADKAWMHMGFDVTGTASLNFKFQYWKSGGSTSTTGETAQFSGTNYREDLYYDLSANTIYMYQNGIYQGSASIGYSGDAKQIKNIYMNKKDGNSFRMSNLVIEYYAEGVTPGDMLIGYDARSTTNPDYIYSISGIQSGTNVIGQMDGVCNITGNNSSGYTLAPNSINANNGGFARYYLNYTGTTGIYQSTDDKVLLHTVTYTPSVVTGGSKHQIGIRGNDGYEWFLTAENGNFYTASGDLIKPYSTSGTYRIDFVINNKDYKYYWLLDGVCFASNTLGAARRPVWQIAYTMRNASDRMVLKNIQTTLYKNNYDEKDIAVPLLTRVYAKNESCTASNGSATVTTSFIGPTTNSGANTKILYGIYDSAGMLLKYQAVDNASGYINGSNRQDTVSIPTGGATLKVFMWNLNTGNNTMTPLSNAVTNSL